MKDNFVENCPCCGSGARFFYRDDGVEIGCTNAYCGVMVFVKNAPQYASAEEAVKRWNRRIKEV